MECVTSGWCQYPTFPGYGPSNHHTCEEVYVSNTPWRASDLLPQFYVWSEQFYPGPGCCRQTDVPIWAAAPSAVPAQVRVTPWDLGDPGPPRLIPFAIGFLQSPCQEDHWWHLVGRHDLANHSLCRDFDGTGVKVAHRWVPSSTPDVVLHMSQSVQLLWATRDLALVPWACGPTYSVLWHLHWHAHILC